MAKKQSINNNDPISKAVDLLLENTEDLTTVFKEGGLYKELTKRLVEKMLNSVMFSNLCIFVLQSYTDYIKASILLLIFFLLSTFCLFLLYNKEIPIIKPIKFNVKNNNMMPNALLLLHKLIPQIKNTIQITKHIHIINVIKPILITLHLFLSKK